MNDREFILDMQARCAAQLDTIVIEPPPPPPPPPPGPVPADVIMIPAPQPGAPAQLQDYAQGATYCFPWPTGGGQLAIDADSGSGAGTAIEIGAAPTAGDWNYAKTNVFGSGFNIYKPYVDGSGNVSLGRPPADTVPYPFFGFFRVTNMAGRMIVQLSAP